MRWWMAGLLGGCSLGQQEEAAERPSVLLITLDTTRADRLGPYGYAEADTPIYDQLAAEGMLFESAYSSCPLTIPSHSTILTGLLPPTHGVRDNGDFVLGDDQVLLSERLEAEGWTTAAFTSAFPTQKRWGFGQGFDIYHDPLRRLPTELDWRDERPAGDVVTDALETLRGVEGPVFVWLHLFDAHWPYAPPEPFLSAHPGRPYDGEIAYAAQEVGRFLSWWDAAHPTSLTILTADHGEGMGDGGEQTHGFLLHDGTIRVPLIVRGRGLPAVPAGVRIQDTVGHTDIVPTVLRVLGLPVPGALQGADLREGGSALAYSEALTGQFNLGLAPLHATTDDAGRYTEGARGEWYTRDGSHVPAAPTPGAALGPHAAQLQALMAEIDGGVAQDATLDPEAVSQLMALGYLGGDPSAEAGDIDPRDVIDVVPLTWQVRQAMAAGRLPAAAGMLDALEARMPDTWGVDHLRARLLQAQGRLEEALHRYVDLYNRAPNSTVALQVARLHTARGDWLEAESWFRDALDHQPNSPEAMGGLVYSLVEQGDLLLAQQLTEQYLSVYPDHAQLQLTQAELLLAEGRLEAAWETVQAALQEMPRSPWAHTTAAEIRWAQGEADESLDLLIEALRIDPLVLPVRVQLTERLLETGRNAESVRTIAPAVRILPDDAQLAALHAQAQEALAAELAR